MRRWTFFIKHFYKKTNQRRWFSLVFPEFFRPKNCQIQRIFHGCVLQLAALQEKVGHITGFSWFFDTICHGKWSIFKWCICKNWRFVPYKLPEGIDIFTQSIVSHPKILVCHSVSDPSREPCKGFTLKDAGSKLFGQNRTQIFAFILADVWMSCF